MGGRLRRFAIRALLAYLAASLAAGALLAEVALMPGRSAVPRDAEGRAAAVARDHGARLEPVHLDAADGVRLHGWRFAGEGGPRATVIVTHGVSANRLHALHYAAFLLDAGFDVLAPDARGHGASGGVATYGVLEGDDLQRWAARAREHAPDRCVFGLGTSMGAAHVLMAEAGRPTFCGIVSDSAFATFLDAGLDRLSAALRLGAAGRWLGRPAALAGLIYAELRYGVDLATARPDDAIARIHAPLLLIHGDADGSTPLYHARALHRAQPAAALWVVAGAGHTGAWRAQPQEYPKRIVAFFRRHE